jgi:hypothetical protein
MLAIELLLLLDMLLMGVRLMFMEMRLCDMKQAYGFILIPEKRLSEYIVMQNGLG